MTVDHNLGASLSEDIPPITNANIAKDMRIVGKFWSDALDNEQETDHDSNSTTGVADGNSSPQEESKDGDQVDSAGFKQVLSKSQKKKMRRTGKQLKLAEKLNVRNRGDLITLLNKDSLLELQRVWQPSY